MPPDKSLQDGVTIEQVAFFRDSGETGHVILQHDWAQSPVGPMAEWPASLHTTLANMLRSAFPMFLFWGDSLTCFYNDPFRLSLGSGGKHPAIGKSGPAVWPEIWDFIGPLIQEILKTGKPSWFRDHLIQFERNGGMEDTYWTFSSSPAYDEHNRIQGVLVTCMETTVAIQAHKKIEDIVAQRTQELEQSHQSLVRANKYLQSIIDLCKEPIQVLEPIFSNGEIIDFRFKLVNTAYSAYANTTPDKLVDRKVGDFFPGYFQTTSFTNSVRTFKTGVSETWEIHYNLDGLDLHNEMTATRMGDQIVLLFIDFTRLKNSEIALVSNIAELKRSNQYLEEFTRAASHDLKEPIRKIRTFTSILKTQLSVHLTEKEIRTFSKIEDAAERMGRLIDDLLQYSHVSQLPMQREAVDLNGIVHQVLEDLELDIQDRHAVVSIVGLKTITGYPRQLQQMFQNLISNALKYSKAGIPVEIAVHGYEAEAEGAPYYVVAVRDNGIGFDQAQVVTILKMVVRLHGPEVYRGTGVGLSIVKKVADNHQGIIKVTSAPNEGSLFELYFPLESVVR